jgi:hypothetical protein
MDHFWQFCMGYSAASSTIINYPFQGNNAEHFITIARKFLCRLALSNPAARAAKLFDLQ